MMNMKVNGAVQVHVGEGGYAWGIKVNLQTFLKFEIAFQKEVDSPVQN
jgi:hypothetical protein